MSVAIKRANNRNQLVLDAAAKEIANKGFNRTTVRDIAKASGMLPGSIYYHYPSKEALLLAVCEQGVNMFCRRFDEAALVDADPCTRLGLALENHIQSITAEDNYSRIVNRVLPEDLPAQARILKSLRDKYDQKLKNLINDLDLAENIGPELLRLIILGASNWTQFWFRKGRAMPADITAQFLTILQNPIGASWPDHHGRPSR